MACQSFLRLFLRFHVLFHALKLRPDIHQGMPCLQRWPYHRRLIYHREVPQIHQRHYLCSLWCAVYWDDVQPKLFAKAISFYISWQSLFRLQFATDSTALTSFVEQAQLFLAPLFFPSRCILVAQNLSVDPSLKNLIVFLAN